MKTKTSFKVLYSFYKNDIRQLRSFNIEVFSFGHTEAEHRIKFEAKKYLDYKEGKDVQIDQIIEGETNLIIEL